MCLSRVLAFCACFAGSACVFGPLQVAAQITPSQSLQQQLQDDQKRDTLERLDGRDEQQQPVLEASPFINVTVPDGLRLEGLRIEGVLPENAAGLEQLLQSWVGVEVNQAALRQMRAEILR